MFHWNHISTKNWHWEVRTIQINEAYGKHNFCCDCIQVNSELIQTSKKEFFAKEVKSFKPSTICARTLSVMYTECFWTDQYIH